MRPGDHITIPAAPEPLVTQCDWRKEVAAGREPITQSIGRAAFEIGLEGIIVPSAADPNGHNLLIFPGNRQPGSEFQVLNPDGLPK